MSIGLAWKCVPCYIAGKKEDSMDKDNPKLKSLATEDYDKRETNSVQVFLKRPQKGSR